MALANALHHGSLRQFSAQYGGWLCIKVALFSRALVMDPDANAPSAVVTPRRRRNSAVKAQWMELLAVESIVDVRKEDKPWTLEDDSPSATLSPPAAARRSRRSSAAEFISMGFGFTVTTTTQTFQFEAATEHEREEWIRCLLLAKKLLSAERLGSSKSEHTDDQDAFFRFAASDSDDSSASEDDDDDDDSGSASENRGVSSIRSAQPLSKQGHHAPVIKPYVVVAHLQSGRSKAITLTILHVTATDPATGDRVEVTVPLSESSQEQVSVKQVKLDAIQQLRSQLYAAHNTSPGLFRDLLRREADFFVLCHGDRELWFKDEQCPIGDYVRALCSSRAAALASSESVSTKRSIVLELRPINTMPHPTLEVAIRTTKTRVSDLSQKTYTAYQLDVSFNDLTWQLARRYKEFDALQRHLKRKYAPALLPKLPPKHVFAHHGDGFVDKRREQLEAYVQQLVLHPLAGTDVLFLSFLGVVSTSRDRELGNREHKPVLHITTLHKSLDCGDILLFSCRFGASVLQRKFTGATYDHVGIVVPGDSRSLLRIMEATSEGIQVYSLKARLMAYAREVSNVIAVRRIQAERSPAIVERLKLFVERVEGNPYSILGILRSQGESERQILSLEPSAAAAPSSTSSSSTSSSASESPHASSAPTASDTLTTGNGAPSSPPPRAGPAKDEARGGADAKSKRKYFCSSLAASTLKHLGWIDTTRSSSHFWPGSFEDGGEIEQYFVPSVARMEPEAVIDCRIVEVGLATPQDAAQPST